MGVIKNADNSTNNKTRILSCFSTNTYKLLLTNYFLIWPPIHLRGFVITTCIVNVHS